MKFGEIEGFVRNIWRDAKWMLRLDVGSPRDA